MRKHPRMYGFYIYCVGVKDEQESRMKHFTIPITSHSVDLEVVPYRNIEAVVGRVPLQDFTEPQLGKHLENKQWLKENVLAHEQMVEEVMRRAPPIVPFKFGTIFRSRGNLTAMLKDQYSRFNLLLKRFRGRQEWGVKLFSHTALLTHAIKRADPELMQITQKMKGQPSGKKYFFEKEFEAQLKEKVEASQHARADDLVRQLSPLYEQCIHNQVLPQALTGREDEMILNVAVLVKEKREAAVRQCIALWDRSHRKEGLLAELTGPWPPYNFTKL